MKLKKDQLGNEIDTGDIVISAASSTGNLKIGKAYYSKAGNLMIEHIMDAGWYWSKRVWNTEAHEYEQRETVLRTAVGSATILFRRADGSYPESMQILMGGES